MHAKSDCKTKYTTSDLLKGASYQGMMEWEKPYIEACVDALQPFGDVLEIGFGCGYSASHIQTYFPKNHTIIESHLGTSQKAKEWSIHYTNVHLIKDSWQKALSQLGIFDAIFFDDYPLQVALDKSLIKWRYQQEDFLFFLEQCLSSHMRKGSRFSCFLSEPTSKYGDKVWFEKIITNPFLDYEERRIPVEGPKPHEALVITITKK